MMSTLAAFALLSMLVAVTPGPDSLLVLRTSLGAGRCAGVRVASGAASGSLAWGISSAAGLTALLAASAQLYRAVQLGGACYLVVLGLRGWRARHSPPGHQAERVKRGAGFRAGLLSNLLNPKVGLFFLAVMPQFIPHHAPVTSYALAFAAIDAVIAAAWLAAVAWISDKARSLLRRPGVHRALDRAAGTALVALGMKIAAEQLA